jgi:hypothetical protein
VRTKNAALGKPAVVATGSCDDGEMIEGIDDDDCVIDMKIGKATRKFSLQVLNTDGDWDTIDSAVAKRGVLMLDVPATDDDGYWLDGQYTFRLFAARSGKNPEYISDDLDILYGTEMSADDTTEMMDDELTEEEFADSGASPELQSAIQDIQQPTTRFDDFCTKVFDRIDCALMFRPGRGPDFITLGKTKWVKMCSTLLKRPEGDCEMEFKFATEMQKPTGMQPGMGGMQPGMQPGSGGTRSGETRRGMRCDRNDGSGLSCSHPSRPDGCIAEVRRQSRNVLQGLRRQELHGVDGRRPDNRRYAAGYGWQHNATRNAAGIRNATRLRNATWYATRHGW